MNEDSITTGALVGRLTRILACSHLTRDETSTIHLAAVRLGVLQARLDDVQGDAKHSQNMGVTE